MPPKLGTTVAVPPGCPLCTSPWRNIEHLSKAGFYYCNVCGQCFQLDAAGVLVSRLVTNKTPARKTDINGNVIDGD